MNDPSSILIVGAGPVGLTAAIELKRRGHDVRIIDKASGPARQSRALAVNPRTLEILNPCGATKQLLELGLEIRRAVFFEPPRELFSIEISGLDHRYRFILSLPQSDTERILIRILRNLGVEIEWDTELTALAPQSAQPSCTLLTPEGPERVTSRYVIGADGAHSSVRRALGIEFHGKWFEHDWGLADVRLAGPARFDELNVYFSQGALCAIIPLIGDRHRIVSDTPEVFAAVPRQFKIEDVFWDSRFRISHRQVETYQMGNYFLAGDAAHVHSPVGGRGMNLGIE
ncbi:MAG: FAD-dependent oxidoreductase, partial [Gammaproteobacteria bacterium]|nr:FAD-dependent oxidoreductase [Gammaproteobacteria bacterium]